MLLERLQVNPDAVVRVRTVTLIRYLFYLLLHPVTAAFHHQGCFPRPKEAFKSLIETGKLFEAIQGSLIFLFSLPALRSGQVLSLGNLQLKPFLVPPGHLQQRTQVDMLNPV
jgi:hypothetical protein